MAAYYVLTHTITDVERYRREYIPATGAILARHGGELLAVSLQAEALHGDPPGAVAVVRFPSEEAVRAFANDPDYQPLKKIRLGGHDPFELGAGSRVRAARRLTAPRGAGEPRQRLGRSMTTALGAEGTAPAGAGTTVNGTKRVTVETNPSRSTAISTRTVCSPSSRAAVSTDASNGEASSRANGDGAPSR